MKPTPEMIAAAWGAWKVRHKGSIGPGPGFVEAITAALSAMPAVRVRGLEWDETRCDPDEYKAIGKDDALGFYYILERLYMSDRFIVTRSSDIQPFTWHNSAEAAKAAAQADYEARILSAIEPGGVGTPPPSLHVAAGGNTIMKADVEKMIRDWQAECADHPALHNQGNVLLGRLKALKASLAMEDFLTGMDCLAEQAQVSMTFSSDDDALEFLKRYGHGESKNGVIRGDWRCFDADCRAAVNYLCDEWDFVFEDDSTLKGDEQ